MNHVYEEFTEQAVLVLPRLRRYARALTHNAADADDLVQVAVERALVRRNQWQPGTNLAGWMITIVRNAWIDESRFRKRQSSLMLPAEEGEQVGDRGMEPEVGLLSIQAALSRLPDEQRDVIALVLIEGFSYREAADLMNIPMGTVMSRLARGRLALQEMLDDGGPEESRTGDSA